MKYEMKNKYGWAVADTEQLGLKVILEVALWRKTEKNKKNLNR